MQNLASARERGVNIRANVFLPESIQKAGFVHHKKRLSMRAAQKEMLATTDQALVEIFQRVETGRVHSEDFAHAQDQDLGFAFQPRECALELICGAEEECAEDAIDHHARRNLFAAQ